jgi:hypothetical protein
MLSWVRFAYPRAFARLAPAAGAHLANKEYVDSSKYTVGQYHWFEDEMPRPGMIPLLGTIITDFSTTYPDMAAYLSTTYGEARLVTKEEYDALHIATWATLADGTKVGWDGIGGVNKFVWDKDADTLQVPDLAGMSSEQVSASLGVGSVHGWGLPAITGTIITVTPNSETGVFYSTGSAGGYSGSGSTSPFSRTTMDIARKVPTAARNQVSAWIALACVYLGRRAL